jgi:hypothetical protein
MAHVLIRMNTKLSPLGELVPLDVELNSLALGIFNFACLTQTLGQNRPLGRVGYEIAITDIRYSNPFDISAVLKSVTKELADFILNRTIFYPQEGDRRLIENAKLREDVISRKLDDLERAYELRNKFINQGGGTEDAVQALEDILAVQNATIRQIEPPK